MNAANWATNDTYTPLTCCFIEANSILLDQVFQKNEIIFICGPFLSNCTVTFATTTLYTFPIKAWNAKTFTRLSWLTIRNIKWPQFRNRNLLWIPHLQWTQFMQLVLFVYLWAFDYFDDESGWLSTSRIWCGNFHSVNVFLRQSFSLRIFIQRAFSTNFTFYCSSDWMDQIELLTHFQWLFYCILLLKWMES